MPRRRLAVALLAPVGVADRVDALRRAVGVTEPFHVPPHITLVPPVNVRDDDVDEVLAILRRAAMAARQFDLTVGPATTFAPETPTLHLAVGGAADALERLHGLRAAVRAGPLDRPDEWPFAPHVTLDEQHPPESIAAAVQVLCGVREDWPVTRVHLLQQHRPDEGRAIWVPEHEEPIGGPALVGRGGIEVVLRTVGMVDASVAALCAVDRRGPLPGPGSPVPLVVVAEFPGAVGTPVGAAIGSLDGRTVALLDAVVVDPDERGAGVGAQLLSAWCSSAAVRGAEVAITLDPQGDEPGSGFLVRHGFASSGGMLVRRL